MSGAPRFKLKWARLTLLPVFPGFAGLVDSIERLVERLITTHPSNEARAERAAGYR